MAGIFLGDLLVAAATLGAWAGLQDDLHPSGQWFWPALFILGWLVSRAWLSQRRLGWWAEIGLGILMLGASPLLAAWPGAGTPLARFNAMALVWLMTGAWRGVVRLAGGPEPERHEYSRVGLLLMVLLASWWAYFCPRIVGVVDERWYGDLMTDYLEQVRAGTFPVYVGQGEHAWNGNVHPFRSAPWHHTSGAIVDLLSLRQLTPLAVQHAVVLWHIFTAGLGLYVGLRRIRPSRPWLALLASVLFVICPAVTMPQVQHDMYMTMAAMPVTVLVALALWRVMEGGSWRAWRWLGAGLGAIWFCHPPMAFLTTSAAAAALLLRLLMDPGWLRTIWFRAGVAMGCFLAVCIGYLISVREFSSLRNPHADELPHVILPGLALIAGLAAVSMLYHHRRPVTIGLAIGATGVGLAAWQIFYPRLLGFGVGLWICWLVILEAGRRWPKSWFGRRPEWMLVGGVIVLGMVLGPRLAGDLTVESWLDSARSDYKQLWLPIGWGGNDQMGWVMTLGLVGAAVAVARTASPALRALFVVVLGLWLSLAPIPGLARFIWQSMPREITDIIGVSYPLRFLPAAAPFCALLVYLALADKAADRWRYGATCGLLALLPWAVWEHGRVVLRSWEYRHPAELTNRHLRSENRPISRFHYDLQIIPRYFNHGVADYRLETRLWLRRPGPGNVIGPNEYAAAINAVRPVEWVDLAVRPDPLYPAWLYLTPRITLAPGERRLLTFEWQDPALGAWLICRSAHLYREYVLPEFGGERGFGAGAGKHQTLSFWNTGTEPEEIELTIKREGADAGQPWPPGKPLGRVRILNYDPHAVPVEITRLPLRMQLTVPTEATVETFRVWLPGYRVAVDGRPTPYYRSHNGLLAFVVPPGYHVADVRFRGTPELRLAAKWSLFVAGVLFAGLAGECWRLARRPSPLTD